MPEKEYKIVNFNEKADIYLINTCTITQEADRKSKQMIRKASHQNQYAQIIVTGCYAQSNYPDLENIKGISLLTGNNREDIDFQLLTHLDFNQKIIKINPVKEIKQYQNYGKRKINFHTRTWIKVQDGCNNFCTYCKVPYVRGRQRSRLPKDIQKEISELNNERSKEVVLLGINLGSYGKDLDGGKTNLLHLISLISDFTNIQRIRLSSIELIHLDEEFFKAFQKFPKLCHHLHIPLQSGDDKILKLMNRPYNSSAFYDKIQKIRKYCPDITITSDIMVGFPQEDEDSFNNSYSFIQKLGLAKIHVFPYSDRKECLSNLLIPKVDPYIKRVRVNRLLALSRSLYYNFNRNNLGLKMDILIEKESKEGSRERYSEGLSSNYLKVKVPGLTGKIGKIVPVQITEAFPNYCLAKLLPKK